MGEGKRIMKEAAQLGMKNLPLTVLYGRPRKFRVTFSKNIPDYADILRELLTLRDSECRLKIHRGGRKRIDIFLSTKENIYIETLGMVSGLGLFDTANLVFKISFWTENEDFIREFARLMNEQFQDVGGILPNIIWEKIEKRYKVTKEECLPTWEKFLA